MINNSAPERIDDPNDGIVTAHDALFAQLGLGERRNNALLFELMTGAKKQAPAPKAPDDVSSRSIIGCEHAHEVPQWITGEEGSAGSQ